ncbi:3-deoxy-D-manno-octulosonic acid transferase [Celeribacter sp. PS-C1]|uniref:3-deoxy-D-manno-octulosonic acid transferase n=1 Tax=Celeribacter sp. PS-C1 TaxID=2820813 RepID=UPI001CA5DDF7|nr:glycosyltransferase N-terminal domain-containing protein [Celeribacter sp. PS-C1]MBW6419370.1 3-deoxy-D-manno-octulosonic acid transferase [Celeribacter sp. PS-C1]
MFLYRFLLTLLSPLFALVLLRQLLRGRERLSDLVERFGADLKATSRSSTPLLWIHGASNGELTAARGLIEEALDRAPCLDILVTVNTVSARKMVAGWALPRVQTRLAPMDLQPVLKRFLAATRPSALVSLENEIWPNRFVMLARHDIPVIVAGARMSERTARRWGQMGALLGGTIRQTIAAITKLAAQDTASEQRLLQLGLPANALLPRMNLKSTVELATAPEAELTDLQNIFSRDKTLLAASTHAGEERPIVEAFQSLQKSHPDARLILAPRHPSRAETIATELTRAGLSFARRSKGDAPESAPIYLADTLGEMALWYRLAGITFVGGSLTDHGGHTPYEPVQFDTAILHGPHVSNHAAAYDALDRGNGALALADAAALAEAVSALMSEPERAKEMAAQAHVALIPLRETQLRQEAFWTALADLPKLQALK